eukprot:505572-Amphidinium_carterae.2
MAPTPSLPQELVLETMGIRVASGNGALAITSHITAFQSGWDTMSRMSSSREPTLEYVLTTAVGSCAQGAPRQDCVCVCLSMNSSRDCRTAQFGGNSSSSTCMPLARVPAKAEPGMNTHDKHHAATKDA